MELIPGYKQSDVGIIPDDWDVKPLSEVVDFANGKPHEKDIKVSGLYLLITLDSIDINGGLKNQHKQTDTWDDSLKKNDLVVVLSDLAHGNLLGLCDLIPQDGRFVLNQRMGRLRRKIDADPYFIRLQINRRQYHFKARGQGTSQRHIYQRDFEALLIPFAPPPEQRAIAQALSDVDALLATLDQLIAKKRNLKQAAMQQLLTGKARLPGFSGGWEVKTLLEITDCLDNLRVPLNEAQREKMQGDYPYCGANGVLGFVGGYVIDDDIILMAEDGGYFDEYETRPIAYRMIGKCWVNNHAHILKAKSGFDQGFIFYSLVHKNILPFLASGTRAKLNKSEMNKIEVRLPAEETEQTAVADILSDMDAELSALEARRDKTRNVKQAMMQELLTGKTRLIAREESHV